MRRIIKVVILLLAVVFVVVALRDLWKVLGVLTGVGLGLGVTYLVQKKLSAASSRPWWRRRSRGPGTDAGGASPGGKED